MITTIGLAIGIVFLAELGDKSQLMALTFALRYRWWVVLGGITAATAAVHVLSVAIGHFIGAALPTTAIAWIAAVTFLAVGVWTLKELIGDEDGEPAPPRFATAAPFFVVLSAFLLAELGDRTMFATAALATDNNWAAVWLGSTIGMVAADALAIAAGILLGKHLPERAIGFGSGLLFLFIGALTAVNTAVPAIGLLPAIGLALAAPAAAAVTLWWLHTRRMAREMAVTSADSADSPVRPGGDQR